jgi:tetratricopeptide (TPR) repeat protein
LTKIAVFLPDMDSFRRDLAHFQHDLLQAEIALAEGAVEKSVEIGSNLSLPEKQVGVQPERLLLSSLPRRDVLARAYHMSGDLDKAIAEYERLLAPDPSGPEIFLIHPRYHYWLAKLYEKNGQAENAVFRYKKFLDIWKDADPDIPELMDTKKRLAILTNTK